MLLRRKLLGWPSQRYLTNDKILGVRLVFLWLGYNKASAINSIIAANREASIARRIKAISLFAGAPFVRLGRQIPRPQGHSVLVTKIHAEVASLGSSMISSVIARFKGPSLQPTQCLSCKAPVLDVGMGKFKGNHTYSSQPFNQNFDGFGRTAS